MLRALCDTGVVGDVETPIALSFNNLFKFFLLLMALKKSEINEFNAKHSNSVSDVDGAKTAKRGGGASGVKLQINDILSFEKVAGASDLEIRRNTEFNEDGSYTCLCYLIRNGAKVLFEAWESFFCRTIVEYDGNKVPTGVVKETVTPYGADTTTPYDFWSSFSGKKVKVTNIERVNTLDFKGVKIISRPFYTWETTD